MAAPAKNFTVIPDSDVDPDSPITTALMTALRDNDQHLEEWLGKNYVAAVDHDHDGINSAIAVASGEGMYRGQMQEIHDHFGSTSFLADVWDVSAFGVTIVADEHYATVTGGGAALGSLQSNTTFQIEQASAVLEMRMKGLAAGTTNLNMSQCGLVGASYHAQFMDEATANEIRCQTVGSAGTENTDDIACDLDIWHTYKIDQRSPTQTVFSIDSAVVATHAAAVPDAQNLRVSFISATTTAGSGAALDYVTLYFDAEFTDSAA